MTQGVIKFPGAPVGEGPLRQTRASWSWEDSGAGGCANVSGKAQLPREVQLTSTPRTRLPVRRDTQRICPASLPELVIKGRPRAPLAR